LGVPFGTFDGKNFYGKKILIEMDDKRKKENV